MRALHEGVVPTGAAASSKVYRNMARNTHTQVITTSRRRRQLPNVESVRQWWRETRGELRKVTWPTTEQTRNLTLVVIAVCVVMGTFLGVVDFVLGLLVRLVIGY
jgi:preprotein translocase subunit SecE